jgi:hypothetical protein
MSRDDKKRALLKGRVTCAIDEADAWITAQAVAIKEQDGFNQPVDAIRNMLTRGECPCRAALRLIRGD